MWGWFRRLMGAPGDSAERPGDQNANRRNLADLAGAMGVSTEELTRVAFLPRRKYRWFAIRKSNGKRRILHEPVPELKAMQRRLLRKVFAKLKVHPAAMGFVRGKSVVNHAKLHVGKKLILAVDVEDFFGSTSWTRLHNYFMKLGWDNSWGLPPKSYRSSACYALMGLTYRKGLPQGAPTSPMLSNAVNYKLDCRLAALAERSRATYSRYADDIVFSFDEDDPKFVRGVLRRIRKILAESGYRINKSKLRLLRRHRRQQIVGLVVNEKVQLPRYTRRLLRAVEHRLQNFKTATMTRQQLEGWRAFERMVRGQAAKPPRNAPSR